MRRRPPAVLFVALSLAAGIFGLRAGVAGSAQANAKQVQGQPATFYWAVLIGITDYAGKTEDIKGAAPDARSMRDHLKSLGWRDDHIMVLTDKAATRQGIIDAIRWLASKSNDHSAAVFHFSGHEMPFHTSADGDNEKRDVAMRTYENKFILDGDLGKELGKVKAQRFWIDFAVCRAGGFNDAGMVSKGRVITYSSPESELSYDDPNVSHSVFSYFNIVQAMQNRKADRNGDRKVTVEEAFFYAKQPVADHTGGRQHPQIVDKLDGDFSIVPPPPPAPTPSPSPTPSGTPAPTTPPAHLCVPGTTVCV